MNIQAFKILTAKWAAGHVIPAIAPEGPLRWIFGFTGMTMIMPLIDKYAAFVPTLPDGNVDMETLKFSFANAFAAQPTLKLTIPVVPQLAAMGMGETVVSFDKGDADSFLSYLCGTTTTKEISL